MSKIYQLLDEMYAEIARIKKSGTPPQYWKPQLEAIQQLEQSLKEN